MNSDEILIESDVYDRLFLLGEKPFKCTHLDCDKSFREYSSLKKHLVVHTGKSKVIHDHTNILIEIVFMHRIFKKKACICPIRFKNDVIRLVELSAKYNNQITHDFKIFAVRAV